MFHILGIAMVVLIKELCCVYITTSIVVGSWGGYFHFISNMCAKHIRRNKDIENNITYNITKFK